MSSPALAIAACTPSAGRSGTVAAFAKDTAPVPESSVTRSVKVPPTSTATRLVIQTTSPIVVRRVGDIDIGHGEMAQGPVTPTSAEPLRVAVRVYSRAERIVQCRECGDRFYGRRRKGQLH